MSALALRRGSSYALHQLARAFNANAPSWIGLVTFLAIVALALLAPLISPYDPLDQDILARLEGPSAAHWLGTDSYGRDILSRLLWGARLSLVISTVSILAAMLIGGVIGILAGYIGGRFDMVVMQAMDVLLSFPSLIMGLMVVAMLGASMGNLMIAIALTAIAPFARIARAPTILVKERDYIEACRALGYSDLRIMAVHILPNIVAEILVMGSLWLATAIRIQAPLSFIGLGGRIDSGHIRFAGRDLVGLDEEEMRKIRGDRISMIFQEPMTSLNPVLTVGFQVAEALHYHRDMGGREANAAALELLDQVKIPSARQRFADYPHQFSGGMRQRVMIAMALACRPELLLADEPTTALDVTIQAQVLSLLAELKSAYGIAMIFITHNLGVVASIADRVAVMYAVEIVEIASLNVLFVRPTQAD